MLRQVNPVVPQELNQGAVEPLLVLAVETLLLVLAMEPLVQAFLSKQKRFKYSGC